MSRRPPELASVFELMDAFRADYDLAKPSRWRRKYAGVSSVGRPADWHFRSEGDYLRMMEIAREFVRNNMIVDQGIDRLANNVLRGGFTLDPRSPDTGVNTAAADRWKAWAEDADQCELSGRFTWRAMEKLVLRAVITDGDHLVLPTRDGPAELAEAHRCRTPKNTKKAVVHGVVIDRYRRPLEYWLTRDDIEPLAPLTHVRDVRQYPARDPDGNRQVFHVYNPKRVSQTRGITALAPIGTAAGMLDEIQFARMVQQLVVGSYAIFRQQPLGLPPAGAAAAPGPQSTERQTDGTEKTLGGYTPGIEYIGRPGETITGFAPNVPNPTFFDHSRLLLTFIAINLNLPLCVFLLDASETNFSGFRGALDQAKEGFRSLQRMLVDMLHVHVYRWKLRQWAAEDPALARAMLKLGPAFFAHYWFPPSWPYIEPLKDASAAVLQTSTCQISQRRRCGEQAIDWDRESSDIVEDNGMLIEKAIQKAEELNQKYPQAKVTWQQVAALPLPQGLSMRVEAAGAEESAAKPGATQGDDHDGD